MNDKKSKGTKIIIAILILIIIILSTMLFLTTAKIRTTVEEKVQTITQKEKLQHELDSLMGEHEKIKTEYSGLTETLNTKDSVILANAQEIKKLIASQADYKQVKRKLDLLRNITQNYVAQIDSLYKVNKILTEENVKVKKEYTQEKQKTTVLQEEKQVLSTKVSKASVFKAYKIVAQGIRAKSGGTKEQVTDKAKRADKVKICFTLSENPIIPAGKKNIYLQIIRPDNVIVTLGDDKLFSYKGKQYPYTAKKEIEYHNEAMDLCMYWEKVDRAQSAMVGKYTVQVFADSTFIGESRFELK